MQVLNFDWSSPTIPTSGKEWDKNGNVLLAYIKGQDVRYGPEEFLLCSGLFWLVLVADDSMKRTGLQQMICRHVAGVAGALGRLASFELCMEMVIYSVVACVESEDIYLL